jgi:hypothetical protein
MMWYGAHIVMAVRYDDPADQTDYPVWENVVLVRADSDEKALQKAEEIGRAGEDDGSERLRWDGKPARWVFAGVRKLIECRTPDDPQDRLRTGTEVTYSQMILDSRETLQKFVKGDPVPVLYEE